MLLRELFEADNQDVAIIFGRFNPPHFGHKAAWGTASQFGNWYVGTNRSTEGPKDPLPFEIKIEAMKTIMPEIDGHIVPEHNWFTLAAWVYKEHGENIILHIVTDSEDAQVFYPAIKKQNGNQGPHGYYKFKDIVWTEAKRLSKATNLRQAIVDNDPDAFSRAAGVPADTPIAGESFFEVVKKYMLPYMEASATKEREKEDRAKAKAEKERAKAEKAKSKQQQGVAEGSDGVSVRGWANQVRKDHGPDVKFWNRKEGGGAVDSVIARNSQGETVGVYNRKTGYPTVFEPKQGVAEGAVKDLMYDLKYMSEKEFVAQYKMSKADARKKFTSSSKDN